MRQPADLMNKIAALGSDPELLNHGDGAAPQLIAPLRRRRRGAGTSCRCHPCQPNRPVKALVVMAVEDARGNTAGDQVWLRQVGLMTMPGCSTVTGGPAPLADAFASGG